MRPCQCRCLNRSRLKCWSLAWLRSLAKHFYSQSPPLHDLRHSHATQLLAAGVHPKIVQERLGHSTITVTMDLYSHVIETIQSDATARLDEAYGQVPKEV